MLNLQYLKEKKNYEVSFSIISPHIVKLEGNFPAKTNGFILSRIGNPEAFSGDYSDYTTVYRELDGAVLFSNDGSIWIEPIPKVTFGAGVGGKLDGIIEQEAKDYSELVIPTPVPDENYEFEGWNQDIQTEGKIEHNISFYATFKSLLPPPEPEPSIEERVTSVEEQNAMLTSCVLEMSEVIYA